MAYWSSFSGKIEIEPPLPWSAFMDTPFPPLRPGDLIAWSPLGPNFSVQFDLHEDWESAPEGMLIRSVATAIRMRERVNGYSLLTELQQIADLVPGTTFTGRIDRVGVDGDQSRYKIIDGVAVEFTPEVIWPEGSE